MRNVGSYPNPIADEAQWDSNKETGEQPIMIAGLDSLGPLLEHPSTRIDIVETEDFLLRERYRDAISHSCRHRAMSGLESDSRQ
jgi:hypothetical protein